MVLVAPLVHAGRPAQVGHCRFGANCPPLLEARHCRRLIAHVVDGAELEVQFLAHHVQVREHPCLLQVAVGDGPVGLLERYH